MARCSTGVNIFVGSSESKKSSGVAKKVAQSPSRKTEARGKNQTLKPRSFSKSHYSKGEPGLGDNSHQHFTYVVVLLFRPFVVGMRNRCYIVRIEYITLHVSGDKGNGRFTIQSRSSLLTFNFVFTLSFLSLLLPVI